MLPYIKIGNEEISKLIVGSNPFVGKSHLDTATDIEMKDYYTYENIYKTLAECEKCGINAIQSRGSHPLLDIVKGYNEKGGNIKHICTSAKSLDTFDAELDDMCKYNPCAIAIHGELADALYENGKLDIIPALLDKIRKKGIPCGLCAHYPEVLAYSEKKGWKPDFYMASLYNLTKKDRSNDIIKTGERFEEADREIMLDVVKKLSAPTIVLKILGAGRRCNSQNEVEKTFSEVFSKIKENDAVLVGMFDKNIEQVRLDCEYTIKALKI